jgi:hypothetical protein
VINELMRGRILYMAELTIDEKLNERIVYKSLEVLAKFYRTRDNLGKVKTDTAAYELIQQELPQQDWKEFYNKYKEMKENLLI